MLAGWCIAVTFSFSASTHRKIMSRRGTTPPGTWQNPAEAGYYYLNSRYYSPDLCRFISVDSMAGVTGDMASYNLFAYCGNNPVNRIDSSGQIWIFLWTIDPILHAANTIAVWFGTDTAAIGAKLLDMRPVEDTYHAKFDCWQANFGYNDLYDVVFDIGTSMDRGKFTFQYKGEGYTILDMISFINSECSRILSVINTYQDKLPVLLNEIYAKVVRWEFASGGENLHRGYYCPSLIIDLVIGQGDRGKILKRAPSKRIPSYEFGYNASNELILVVKNNDGRPNSREYELIQRGLDCETGIFFDKSYPDNQYHISQISECIYDQNRIKSYALFQYMEHRAEILEMRREDYVYAETTMDVSWLHFRSNMDFVMRHEFCFAVDNRRLIQYTHRELSGNQADPNHVYDVRIARHIP